MNPAFRELKIPASLSGKRLDFILAELCPDHSKAALQKLVRRGGVDLDGKRVLRSNIRPGRCARLALSFEGREQATESFGLIVLHEDDSIIVVDKPAGLLSHGFPGSSEQDVAMLATERFGRLPMLMGEERPGVVHRLDRETSGVMVLARTAEAMEYLREQFRARQVRKEYFALVRGVPVDERMVLDADLGPCEGHSDRQQQFPPGRGKNAHTSVELMESFGDCSLLSCVPRTGRRHQIRVHLHAAGHAVLGDKMYGAKSAPGLSPGMPHSRFHCLHAGRLSFDHPEGQAPVHFESPMRPEMAQVVDWLRRR
ncbi:MAG: 23S rRNA pseudouridine1911/1915/1917 synthase [Planctomycetota bacterium]|jgi:23S rRNA pseudouridine1911/1915/1917 synthase